MDQDVSEPCDLPPSHPRTLLPDRLRDLLDRLSNDLEVADNGIRGLGIVAERLEGEARGIEADLLGGFENVFEVDPGILE